MVAGLSFIGGFITEKFFVGRKIELLREDNNSKIEQLKKDQNAIGELLRIIEIAKRASNRFQALRSSNIRRLHPLTRIVFPTLMNFPKPYKRLELSFCSSGQMDTRKPKNF